MAVDFQAEVAQACSVQPAFYNLEGSHLFTDKKDALPDSQQFGNGVGNGLGLPGPRRPFNHKVLSAFHVLHNSNLGRVGVQDMVSVLCREFKVHFLFQETHFVAFGVCRI